MTIQIDMDLLQDFVQDGEIRSYSGRGMYGRVCVGLETDGRGIDDLIGFVKNIADAAAGDDPDYPELVAFFDQIQNVSVDNMGMGMIYYWTRVEPLNADDEED